MLLRLLLVLCHGVFLHSAANEDEDVPNLEEELKRIDTDGDGLLNLEELLVSVRQSFPQGMSQDNIEKKAVPKLREIFAEVDSEGTGKIGIAGMKKLGEMFGAVAGEILGDNELRA